VKISRGYIRVFALSLGMFKMILQEKAASTSIGETVFMISFPFFLLLLC
jgi:hypothetical protein